MDKKEILIRKADLNDLESIHYLYARYMPDSYLYKLGDSFIKSYLAVILGSKNCAGFIAEEKNAAGFIIAALNRERLSAELLSSAKFLFSCVAQALTHPVIFLKSISLVFYLINRNAYGIDSELLFIAIDPDYRREGLGSDLVKKSLNFMKENGIKNVRVSTVAGNKAAGELLIKLGFKLQKTFKLLGKVTYLYAYEIY
jgi:ribosomal protein S18 acetylase RimI-like enzyme